MKRDWDLIKELLMKFESLESANYFVGSMVPMGDTPAEKVTEWNYVRLLVQGGFLEEIPGGAVRITWSGHDLIDTFRDESVWERTKQTVTETGGNASLEVFKSIAMAIAKKKIEDTSGLKL